MNRLIREGILFLLFFFIAGEIATRTRDSLHGYKFFSNNRNQLVVAKHPIIPFRTFGPKLYAVKNDEIFISSSWNELYPIKKTANTFRIVCFGGSTTQDYEEYLKWKIHYPILLQRLLQKSIPQKNFEVINIAYNGYSTVQSLIELLLDVVSWEPDLVIINHNWNDMDASYFYNLTFDYANKYNRKFFNVPELNEQFAPMDALFHWSSFYWYLKDKFELRKETSIQNDSDDVDFINIKHKNQVTYGNDPPKLSQEIFRRNLLNFYYIAHGWGIPVLYATQPLKSSLDYSEFKPPNLIVKDYQLPNIIQRRAHHKFFNKIIKEVAIKTNSYFIDLDSLLGGNPENYIDGLHYSKIGTERVAKYFYNCIISNHIVK